MLHFSKTNQLFKKKGGLHCVFSRQPCYEPQTKTGRVKQSPYVYITVTTASSSLHPCITYEKSHKCSFSIF